MGSFSWLKADNLTKTANIVEDRTFKFLIPKEFGGGYIKERYQGYGLLGCKSDGKPMYDMYELLAIWNKETFIPFEDAAVSERLKYDGELLGLKPIDSHTNNNRLLGIQIGTYKPSIDRLKYPLKLVSASYTGTYEECDGRSYADPNQGWAPLSRSDMKEIELV